MKATQLRLALAGAVLFSVSSDQAAGQRSATRVGDAERARLAELVRAAVPSNAKPATMPWQPEPDKQEPRIVADQVVVKLKAEFAKRAAALPEESLPQGFEPLERFLEAHGIADGHRLARSRGTPLAGEKLAAFNRHGMDRIYVLRLPVPDVRTVLDLVSELSREPWVEYAHAATYGTPLAAPNDPFYGQQWAHNNTGQGGGTADADMDTQEAWDAGVGLSSVIIAVADTGTLTTHPDLSPNLVPNCGLAAGTCYDFGDDDPNPNPTGDTHGTNTAGIVAARGNNAVGVAGTCQRCSLMAIKTCSAVGCSSTAFQDAIIHAANNGARAISMSFCFGWSQAWVDAVNTAKDMGTLSFASLGNSTTYQSCTPAVVPGALAIGGTDRRDRRIFAKGSHQFVTGPGEGIYSTTVTGANLPAYSTNFGGTSASCPFAAGVAGLLWSQDATLHVGEIESLLSLGADDQVGPAGEDTAGFDENFGHGRLNARNAINLINAEWINIFEPQHVCGRTITIGYHNAAGCDGETVNVMGDIGGDVLTATLSQVSGDYCETTVNLDWAAIEAIDTGDAHLTIEHGETITAQKNGVQDVSTADCTRSVCHWPSLTDWNFRHLIAGDCDNDGALDPGHLLRIAPALVNVETEPMTGLIMSLSSDSPYLDFVVDTLAFGGELAPFNGYSFDVDVTPMFTVRVLPGAPPNSAATIRVALLSSDGWVGGDVRCDDFGFTNEITIPLNRDTGPEVQEFNFDDGTTQGWVSASPHGTGEFSECNDAAWDGTQWNTVARVDRPHQGTHAMRLGDRLGYADYMDSALQSPSIAVPSDGVLGFYIYADLEPAAPGFGYDGIALEGKATGLGDWEPLPVSRLGSFSSFPAVDSCAAASGNSFPFGIAEPANLIAGNGDLDSPFGDAYDYEHYVDLSGFGGQNAQIRFRAGSDVGVQGLGAWVDTIRVYDGWIGDSWPGIGPDQASVSDAGCPASFDVASSAVPGAAGYNLYKSDQSCADAMTRADVFATSPTPDFTDTQVTPDEGAFYAIEAFEPGTTCPTTRVCVAGGCCSSPPADPTGLRVELGGADVGLSWDDPGIAGTTWFLYYDTDRDPSTWGQAQTVDISDEDLDAPGIQHFAVLPDPAPDEVIYVQVTAVDCGESPLF